MSKKHTYEYIKNYFESKEYELVSKVYVGAHELLIIKDIYGYIYKISFANLTIGNKPCLCSVSNPYSIDNIKLWLRLNNKPFKLVDTEFVKVIKHLTFIDYEGYLYYASMNTLLSYCHNPLRFDKSNPYTIQNIKLWCKLNNKPFELVSETYNGNSKHLEWHCLEPECGEIFKANWQNISQHKKCSYCSGKKVGLSNCLATKNSEIAREWHPTKNGELTPYDITCGNSKINIWWQCLVDPKHIWRTKVLNRTSGNGCPECNKSKGEKQLDNILTKYNIPHDRQYTFDDLRGIGNGLLKFDIPVFWNEEKTKLRMLIEYDGIFHYEKQYDDDSFETLQIHDKLKNDYCQKNNIELLRIPYWDFDNIKQILDQHLNLYYEAVV